ncbi:AtpZ/AtpI family protein [Parafilimonas sp.]|uniref:AtpZ/AtpI family protein n=1 Tax=Parafilimonas sp. TaxID=1969739 RepID=UPI0039E23A95
MIEPYNKKEATNKNLLVQYAGIGAQIVAGLLVFIFAGKWMDEKLRLSFPLLIWIMPLVFIIGMIIKVIKDTSTRKKDE